MNRETAEKVWTTQEFWFQLYFPDAEKENVEGVQMRMTVQDAEKLGKLLERYNVEVDEFYCAGEFPGWTIEEIMENLE